MQKRFPMVGGGTIVKNTGVLVSMHPQAETLSPVFETRTFAECANGPR